MKILKLFLPLLILSFFLLTFNNCGDEKKEADKNGNSEAIKLEQVKNKKQREADSLKNEIEILKSKRDSLNKRIKDEQN